MEVLLDCCCFLLGCVVLAAFYSPNETWKILKQIFSCEKPKTVKPTQSLLSKTFFPSSSSYHTPVPQTTYYTKTRYDTKTRYEKPWTSSYDPTPTSSYDWKPPPKIYQSGQWTNGCQTRFHHW